MFKSINADAGLFESPEVRHQEETLRQSAGLLPMPRGQAALGVTPAQLTEPDYEQLVSRLLDDPRAFAEAMHGPMPAHWPAIGLDPQRTPVLAELQEGSQPGDQLAAQLPSPAIGLDDLLCDPPATSGMAVDSHLTVYGGAAGDGLSWQDNLQLYYQSLT